MLENVLVGNVYQNIKTGNIYVVTDIAKYSEDPSQRFVIYERKDIPFAESWARPLELFKEKFREAENDY